MESQYCPTSIPFNVRICSHALMARPPHKHAVAWAAWRMAKWVMLWNAIALPAVASNCADRINSRTFPSGLLMRYCTQDLSPAWYKRLAWIRSVAIHPLVYVKYLCINWRACNVPVCQHTNIHVQHVSLLLVVWNIIWHQQQVDYVIGYPPFSPRRLFWEFHLKAMTVATKGIYCGLWI